MTLKPTRNNYKVDLSGTDPGILEGGGAAHVSDSKKVFCRYRRGALRAPPPRHCLVGLK